MKAVLFGTDGIVHVDIRGSRKRRNLNIGIDGVKEIFEEYEK